jgi:hypothetical protein
MQLSTGTAGRVFATTRFASVGTIEYESKTHKEPDIVERPRKVHRY